MPRIFISYRREDSAGYVQSLSDRLGQKFGPRNVFRDVDSIAPGRNFVSAIRDALTNADVVLALIGPRWLTVADEAGRRRLDDPEDYVAMELQVALELGRPIIPVLVQGAKMPSQVELPAAIRDLALQNAAELTDSRWAFDFNRLVQSIERHLPPKDRLNVRLRRHWRLAAGALVALSALMATAIVVFWDPITSTLWPRPALGPMTGTLNIVVAEFGQLDAAGRVNRWGRASELATSVHSALDRTIGEQSDRQGIETRSPTDAGLIAGSTPEERARNVQSLAERFDAHIVVFGNVEQQRGAGRFTPELYISRSIVKNAEEFAGTYSLGRPIEYGGDLATESKAFSAASSDVLARTQALVEFARGLRALNTNDLETARSRFTSAEATNGWSGIDGKEMFYLFSGHLAGRQNLLDEAASKYDQALKAAPGFARAQLGQAEVTFQRARSQCEPPPDPPDPSFVATDRDGLYRALAGFDAALAAPIQPTISNVPIKVTWFKGRVFFCLSTAELEDRWDDAERAFRQVTVEYEGGNTQIQEMAATAYALLGQIQAAPPVDDPNPAASFDRASASFRRAIEISENDELKSGAYRQLGYTESKRGDAGAADAAYAEALRLQSNPSVRAQIERERRQYVGSR